MAEHGTNYTGTDFYCDVALKGVVALRKEYESERVLAYHHTRPFWPVHIVVIPKQHIPSLVDLGAADEALLARVFAEVRRLAAALLEQEGACRVITNLGRYQESKHLHFHVVSGQRLT